MSDLCVRMSRDCASSKSVDPIAPPPLEFCCDGWLRSRAIHNGNQVTSPAATSVMGLALAVIPASHAAPASTVHHRPTAGGSWCHTRLSADFRYHHCLARRPPTISTRSILPAASSAAVTPAVTPCRDGYLQQAAVWLRHIGRAFPSWPGHPRLAMLIQRKTWMAGTSMPLGGPQARPEGPAMTREAGPALS
jgi:hypothetical protein